MKVAFVTLTPVMLALAIVNVLFVLTTGGYDFSVGPIQVRAHNLANPLLFLFATALLHVAAVRSRDGSGFGRRGLVAPAAKSVVVILLGNFVWVLLGGYDAAIGPYQVSVHRLETAFLLLLAGVLLKLFVDLGLLRELDDGRPSDPDRGPPDVIDTVFINLRAHVAFVWSLLIRHPESSADDDSRKFYDRLTLLMSVIALTLVVTTYQDYGITIDEPVQTMYGDHMRRYYETKFEHTTAVTFSNLYLYGGGFDAIVSLLQKRLPMLSGYEGRHLLNGLCGLLSIWGAVCLGRLLAGSRGGFWAGAMMLLTPVYYGHMFNNPKDIPFATGYIWAVYYLVCVAVTFPHVSRGLTIKLGVAMGATMAVRVAGLLVVAYAGALLFILVLGRVMAGRVSRADVAIMTRAMGAVSLSIAVAYGLMLAFWPWALQDPLHRPFAALRIMNHFPWEGVVTFAGAQVRASSLPWSYLPQLLFLQLPELALPVLAAGSFLALSQWRVNRAEFSRRAVPVAVVAFATGFPLVYAIATKAVLYDNFRHMLFIVLPLMVLCGVSCAALLRRLDSLEMRRGALALRSCLGVYLLHLAHVSAQLHPHQYIYYNAFVGGLPGAAGKYETDYWANGLREAISLLERRVALEARGLERAYLVSAGGPSYLVQLYLESNDRLVFTTDEDVADFHVAVTRDRAHIEAAGTVFVRVERFGVPLAVVMDRRTGGHASLSTTVEYPPTPFRACALAQRGSRSTSSSSRG